jgi:hypothetical protein
MNFSLFGAGVAREAPTVSGDSVLRASPVVRPCDTGSAGTQDITALNARIEALQECADKLLLESRLGSALSVAALPGLGLLASSSPLLTATLRSAMLMFALLKWRMFPLLFVLLAASCGIMQAYTTACACLLLAILAVYACVSARFEPARRRLFVFSMALTVWVDYRIVRRITAELDEHDSAVVWTIAHRRCVCVASFRRRV